ncbi:heme d1 biosynthesis radical SAM protein NirJ [Thalassolituus sp. ST750PaO-4]|uniref:heme d1 biosynthesis radical SAM protein NirJ n=1 Tax=Thalassolituus sp. ST750PaO-4 TaxID=2742965 RepID=UPI000C698708|nr:heme d1 biosynthesis radical SAM protein NirJ [Thalassolituus sp. ST750PaO-4]MCA6058729.1 heme d1 biosynthesis radical SAM protein NirJ [Thalassolituus sp. ST750PaO-4]PIQ38953.1 MAG: heme d1 biosynthesis radical SAM protein NirJ [Thalassolituus sp. CG17_big_fil_post_rev_8_21_14_2_50_53_8]
MFRLTQQMEWLLSDQPLPPARKPPGPVVIWNLIRRCNLTCKHCYSTSADTHFHGELSTEEVFRTLEDLRQFRVPALILSGGEPLMRPDIYDIARKARELGFYVGLSTNGTLINRDNIQQLAAAGFDYVGISLDGDEETHDRFRQMKGAYRASLDAMALCREHGIRVGGRFTLTEENAPQLPAMLDLMDQLDIDKFYLSHLNYAGRGGRNRKQDAFLNTTRRVMTDLFERCQSELKAGKNREYVTGNNDADGVWLLMWARQHYPERADLLQQKLVQWGGNSSGVNIANIDNLGQVHPDTFWWKHNLGNVRERPFSDIWRNTTDPLMQGMRQTPRPLEGRCATCQYLNLCGGNTRVRAFQMTGNPWAEDPACYLSDDEINPHQPVQIPLLQAEG